MAYAAVVTLDVCIQLQYKCQMLKVHLSLELLDLTRGILTELKCCVSRMMYNGAPFVSHLSQVIIPGMT